jgi:hypothetical protein
VSRSDAAQDVILYGGRIATLNRANPLAEAVAITGGRFSGVGRPPDVGSTNTAHRSHWQASASRLDETGVQDGIQHLAPANHRYGHWRIGAILSRAGCRAKSLCRC